MMSISMSEIHVDVKFLAFSHQKCDAKVLLVSCNKEIKSYIRAPVLLNLLNLLRKKDKMLSKAFHLISNHFIIKFNNT